MLGHLGYETVTAVNGEEGLEKFKYWHPDVIITDVKMPQMDGKVFCEQLNKMNNENPYFVIVITCSVSESNLQWIDNIGDAILLEKPFSPSRVLEVIEDYIKK